MNIKLENAKSRQCENFTVINFILGLINRYEIKEIQHLYDVIKAKYDNSEMKELGFIFGRGGSHLWVQNYANQRLMIVTNNHNQA